MAVTVQIQLIVILCKFFKRCLLSVVEVKSQRLATEVRVRFHRPPCGIFGTKVAQG